MATSFGPETQVLWYGPWAHADPGNSVYLLWPAWAHRVMAPEVRDRPLNPLALAILGLLAASRLTRQEIAEHLGIQAELASFILTDLEGSGYLDHADNLTERGRTLLEDERDMQATLLPGWVFRDPWRESLWPFVARDLAPASTTINERGFPELVLGTTGKPFQRSAFLQRPPEEVAPKPPLAREILRAARDQRRIAKRLARTDRDRFWGEESTDPFDPKRLDLSRVAQIESEAHPVLLATFLYVPKDGPDQGMDWYACDFFGRAESLELRRQILSVADGEPLLARQLDRVIGGTRVATDYGDFRKQEAARRARAQLTLDEALGLDVRRHAVHGALVRLFEAWLEVGDLVEPNPRRCDNVLRECRTVLEGVFVTLRQAYPLTGIAAASKDYRTRTASYRSAASSLGLGGLPDVYLKVHPNQLGKVINENQNWRFRPLVMATLLAANANPDHPMRGAVANQPALLERIESVLDPAGNASHYGDQDALDPRGLRHLVNDTLNITGSLLDLPVTPTKEQDQA